MLSLGAKRDLRLGLGLGPVLGVVAGYGDGGAPLFTLGGSAEAGLGYSQRFRVEQVRGFLQVGIRLDFRVELNADPESYLDGGPMVHVQRLFARIGVAWR